MSSDVEPTTSGTARRAEDPHYRLTLPQLQQLYTYMRPVLLREAEAGSGDPALARNAIQEAFAGAARTRFCFRSEQAAITWVRTKIAEHMTTRVALSDSVEVAYEWPDVLRRANIETLQSVEVASNAEPLGLRGVFGRRAHGPPRADGA